MEYGKYKERQRSTRSGDIDDEREVKRRLRSKKRDKKGEKSIQWNAEKRTTK